MFALYRQSCRLLPIRSVNKFTLYRSYGSRNDDSNFNSNFNPRSDNNYGRERQDSNYGRGRRDSNYSRRDSNYSRPNEDDEPNKWDIRAEREERADSETDWSIPLPPNAATESILFPKNVVQTGINFDKYSDIPVEITEGAADPIRSLDQHDFGPILNENIERMGYKTITPIQQYSIPVLLNKQDLMACAQTGSGKTAAFILPIISSIYDDFRNGNGRSGGPTGLVISPTRELASQIYDEALKFSYRTRVRPCVIYGGASDRSQLKDLSYGCDLLIATPGRLLDFLERGEVKLDRIQYLVLDEADRMLDMGFSRDLDRICKHGQRADQFGSSTFNDRTTAMFSATFPAEIQQLARKYLQEYKFLTVGRVGGVASDITQQVIYVRNSDKLKALIKVIESVPEDDLIIVFCQTKRTTQKLCDLLNQVGAPATTMHGDLTQRQRERSLHDFKTKRRSILVATDVAARGLDVPNVGCVVNYDLPSEANKDSYTHRVGRTGRMGNTGNAVSFFSEDNNKLAPFLYQTLKDSDQEVPDWLQGLAMSAGDTNSYRQQRFGSEDTRNVGRKRVYNRRDDDWSGNGDRWD